MIRPSPRPPFPYCPWCTSTLSQDNPFRQVCSRCGFILYHSSSPCMGAIPLDSTGKVLLAQRAIEPFFGQWNIIGGFLNYQEDPLEGLVREVREETGVDCTVLDFITMTADIYGEDGQALMNTYFTVKLLSQEFTPQDDVRMLRWFSLDALPDALPFASDRKALAILRHKIQSHGLHSLVRCHHE
ncbi:MAG: NUDIX domain-containing protein [Desulfobacterota bacterium]|nr:NUDIX domain-containing protein [Thermodesulfobacteriota bacterium]